ncbi:hypothetical protein [Kozakia baliensis]|uniref:hypothetical protein n=1 Tax=Kozakia baliensis TaxID=153496 RepID=UPI0004960C9D|nr:hypothetical protein [Kozakia baliensis]AOX20355.1 hypothetical protein A0U90_08660 [Kozakia baliensis]
MGDGRVPLWLCSSVSDWTAARRGHAAVLAVGNLQAGPGWLVMRNIPLASHNIWGAHGANCACCQVHDEAAQALNLLFMDRVRRRCGDFTDVVLLETPGRLPMRAASLNANKLVSARFRLKLPFSDRDTTVSKTSRRHAMRIGS